jgi:ABC-type Fe3+ transport system permease subunit
MNSKNNRSKSEHDRGYGCILICLGLFIGVVIGTILGAFLLSFFQYQYYVYFTPDILKDGQFGMVFLNTAAIGGVSGGLIGAILGVIAGWLIVRRA